MTISKLWVSSLALLATVSLPLQAASPVTVGSKIDTEGALLGNMILQVLESHGVKTVNKIQLGTTPVVSWRDYRRRAGYLSGIHR
ncbi:Osmoprotectant ABC transporter binding proteinYehZ [Salmonella enterica subsp. enterica]|uniref:Osmoprotectant ABC transporter binding proteinYehZ n=1 Tax=Salmonella enterica I TaxID=59201 RepID=A0A3S4LUG7_SALET|nr:Osmoprotectant ABC transporter binding proteinYehZ [Salmonella enterica subsp. enterica]